MKNTFLVISFLICTIVSSQDIPFEFHGKIVGISDGDTFKVLYQGKKEIKVRLNHIDAPEKGQPYANTAKKYASDLCFGKEVKIIRQKKKDRYKRIIAEVFLDNVNINKELVREGYAWHFKKYSSSQEYAQIEMEARKNRKGLWQDKHPVAPWDWRKRKKTPSNLWDIFIKKFK